MANLGITRNGNYCVIMIMGIKYNKSMDVNMVQITEES